MKHLATLFICLAVLLLPAAAQNSLPRHFAGNWWLGILEEASLPLNITFASADNGTLEPVLYSPLQGREPIPVTKWSFENDTLRISNKKIGIRITLRWNASDSCFEGKFVQQMYTETLRFEKTGGMFELVRSQTPQPPYPYREEEVVKVCRKTKVTLSGTLTLPEGEGPFPAVVLVSGSGQQNRDEELLGHRPFFVLADYLSRHGIAVLRYDDRGVGGSKGEVQNATSLDFADDAEAMFTLLRKDKRIDPKKVGIVGHSEGALIACIVAARNKNVAGIVMLGGQGGNGADILLQQNELIYLGMNIPRRLVDMRLECLRALFALIDSVPPDSYSDACQAAVADITTGLDNDDLRQIGMRKGDVMLLANQMQMAWMKAFLKIDNTHYLRRIKCPILAIAGEQDVQVPPRNLELIATNTAGRAETHLMPGLNHLMQHCTTGMPNEYFKIEETMSEDVMLLVATWILEKMSK